MDANAIKLIYPMDDSVTKDKRWQDNTVNGTQLDERLVSLTVLWLRRSRMQKKWTPTAHHWRMDGAHCFFSLETGGGTVREKRYRIRR